MDEGMKPKREGLQVVKLSEEPGQRYELDEEALKGVLLREDIRNLPVAVVSVAGAFRGGKSFILDFFLRYLNAPAESQLTTEWLGGDEDLLEGFDWRGGGESNTKGIHIWPEPIVVSIPETGEKVAVLLMDTQGTFDMESDLGDNSTIFALSTLLSSVQIYNLRANIGEDDLQHLQLFTEYGKLVTNTEGKAFQTLLFLVRDWFSPYEHPYGYIGGEGLMNKRFQPKLKQKKQLQEVRQHIHSCFEKLLCFLMPFPGPMVANAQFRGRLCDIEKDFKESLLELVPSLLAPGNLTAKVINGDKVQAQGLLEFFKRYVDIFNSDDLPEATTIFQATVDACMMSILREARERYENKMEPNIVENQTVTINILNDWHNAAVAAAIAHFEGKKKLGFEDNVNAHLVDLKKELEARLARYLLQNDAKLRVTFSNAKKAYDDVVSTICQEQSRICLHIQDLSSVHTKALNAALDVFDPTRASVPKESDADRKTLIENLDRHYENLCSINEQNNKNATLAARELYLIQMKDSIDQQGVSSEELKERHKVALAAATVHFQSLRNQPTKETTDPHLEQLQKDIESYFVSFKKSNAHSNLLAMQIAELAYNNFVSLEWAPQSCCFHPKALQQLHEEAKKCALKQFLTDRVESVDDDYKDKLIANLEVRYGVLQKNNEYNNRQTVDQAYAEYLREMDNYSKPGLKALLIVTFLVKSLSWSKYHEKAKKKAMNVFDEKRRGATYDDDEYLDKLKEKIDEAYGEYKNPLKALGREIGL